MTRTSGIRTIDLASWVRRPHYELFRAYEDPFFGVTVDVDVTTALARSRAPEGPSFFLSTLHAALAAAQEVEELRCRIRDHDVVVHDVVHGGSTVLRPNGTFTFAYFDYDPDFARFAAPAAHILESARSSTGTPDPQDDRDDLIHFSVLPWLAFTSFSHARRRGTGDSIPKIVFGRHRQGGAEVRMPVAIDVHHALVDGLHVGRFVDRLQHHLDGPRGPTTV